ncbi:MULTISPECIES: hypothetical protein [Ruminococcus]|uniref:Sensory transduction regulator n=1 Tax=Ruminococcus flavefaciens TaxID=1265 RepID=A0A1M7GNC8_RUMFL|nr:MULTISPECIES: hypothetical protein [Ruminococcus]MCR4795852.1 hypothetical protein [Ruminococcus sp.]SHM17681.1 hypothetical protein SAMN04487860_101399 [Ruminococcus flavefaciens]
MADNTMSKVVADFCELLRERNVPFETNEKDANMLRFRTKLPHNESVTPLVFIHVNGDTNALSLALSQMVRFNEPEVDVYKVINEFNSDPECFGCKMFIDERGELIVLVNSVVGGETPHRLVEDYLNISILCIDKHLGKILEIIKNSENN